MPAKKVATEEPDLPPPTKKARTVPAAEEPDSSGDPAKAPETVAEAAAVAEAKAAEAEAIKRYAAAARKAVEEADAAVADANPPEAAKKEDVLLAARDKAIAVHKRRRTVLKRGVLGRVRDYLDAYKGDDDTVVVDLKDYAARLRGDGGGNTTYKSLMEDEVGPELDRCGLVWYYYSDSVRINMKKTAAQNDTANATA